MFSSMSQKFGQTQVRSLEVGLIGSKLSLSICHGYVSIVLYHYLKIYLGTI